MPYHPKVHGHRSLRNDFNCIPPENRFKETVVHIEIGQQVFTGFLASCFLSGIGIDLFLEIGFHAFFPYQFEVLFWSEDYRVTDIEVPNALCVDISVELGVIGILGDNAFRIFQYYPTQGHAGLYRIPGLFFLGIRKVSGTQKQNQ